MRFEKCHFCGERKVYKFPDTILDVFWCENCKNYYTLEEKKGTFRVKKLGVKQLTLKERVKIREERNKRYKEKKKRRNERNEERKYRKKKASD